MVTRTRNRDIAAGLRSSALIEACHESPVNPVLPLPGRPTGPCQRPPLADRGTVATIEQGKRTPLGRVTRQRIDTHGVRSASHALRERGRQRFTLTQGMDPGARHRLFKETRAITDREHPMITERSHPGIHRDPPISPLMDTLPGRAGAQPIGWIGTGRNQHQVSVQRQLDT